MKMKKLLSLSLACMMTAALAACGGPQETAGGTEGNPSQEQQNQEPSGDDNSLENTAGTEGTEGTEGNETAGASTEKSDEVLNVVMPSEPANLWVAGSGRQDNSGQIVQNCLTDRLVVYDMETGEVKPCLATAWEWVDDMHIKFTLRDDVLMTDGTPLVAEDVLYTFATAAENCATSENGRYFDPATSEAVDEHTVIVGLNVVAPDFVAFLAESAYGIVSEDEVNAAGGVEAAAKKPLMGAGKYKFKEWTQGQSIVIERNEDYWDKDVQCYYKEIRFTFTNDAAAREMAVESGDADIALEIPVNIAQPFENSDTIQTSIYPTQQVQHMFLNCRDGACTDLKVRQAIGYALDPAAICQVATAGYGQISNGWYMPGGKYYVDAYNGEERKPDIEKAKALLQEAGHGDGLSIKTVVRQDMVSTLTVIQENLRAAGIELEINALDTAQFVSEAMAGNYDIILVGSNVEVRKPNLFSFFQMGNYETIIGGPKVTTEELDTKIRNVIETKDEAEAKKLSDEVVNTLKDQMYSIDLYTEYTAVFMGKNIAGLRTIERGYVDCTSLYGIQ